MDVLDDAVTEFDTQTPPLFGAAEAMLAQLHAENRELRQLLEAERCRLDGVEADFKVLRAIVMQNKRIDIVRMKPFLNLIFREDSTYIASADSDKENTLFDLERHEVASAPLDHEGFLESWKPGHDILELILAAFAKYCPKLDFIDVGCQYGTLSMRIALFIRSMGLDIRVHAFDCGVARELAGCNFVNNGFEDMIDFYPYAVGAREGFISVHRDVEHSEGNRIGGAISTWDRGSTDEAVRCVTLDSLVELGRLDRAAVLKIDTEGAEPAVLRGASRILDRTPCAIMMEFSPSGFGGAIGHSVPETFLADLFTRFYIIHIGREHDRIELLHAGDLAALTRSVRDHPAGWTDLVLLDRVSGASRWTLGKLIQSP